MYDWELKIGHSTRRDENFMRKEFSMDHFLILTLSNVFVWAAKCEWMAKKNSEGDKIVKKRSCAAAGEVPHFSLIVYLSHYNRLITMQ